MTKRSAALLQQGLDYQNAGRLDAAWAIYLQLLADDPSCADAWQLSGLIAAQRGDTVEAAQRFERATQLQPNRAGFLINLATALQSLGHIERALSASQRAIQAEPGNPIAWLVHGRMCAAAGQPGASISAHERSLALNPNQLEALAGLARLLAARRDWRPTLALARRAVALAPQRRDLQLSLAEYLLDAGDTVQSLATLEQLSAQNPGDADLLAACGQVMIRQQRFEDAIGRYQQALMVRGDCRLALDGLVAVFTRLGRIDEGRAVVARKLALWPDDAASRSQDLFLLNYMSQTSAAEISAKHLAWGKRLSALIGQHTASINQPDAARRLRVGYVSSDFRRHSVAYFIAPLLAGHRRDQVEVLCYSNTFGSDDFTARLSRLADVWREVTGLGDMALIELIRQDKIDLLIDLNGHTADNRLAVFAHRAAPVQLSWLGYPNTTGLPGMDYRISDPVADPPGVADALCSESLIRLPGGFLCYRPEETGMSAPVLTTDAVFVPPSQAGPPANAAQPSAPSGPITFASFNHIAKLSEPVIALWSRLLLRLPHSRLLLKAAGLDTPSSGARIRAAFAAAGVDPGRVQLAGATANPAAHLAAYRTVDIALDPFPYNGTTTTCDALWMGVPVITLAGDRHASRVGASLMHTIGHPELVTESAEDYLALAVALAGDPTRLAALHRDLRQDMRRSPLMDEAGFVLKIEAAYRDVWRTACARATGETA